MIKTTITFDEQGRLRAVSLWGHASNYNGQVTQNICFAVSSVIETINRVDPEGVMVNERGNFTYSPKMNLDNPSRIDEKKFTILELLINHILLLASVYNSSFIIERRISNYAS